MTDSFQVKRPSQKRKGSIVFLELFIYWQVKGTMKMLGKRLDKDELKRIGQSVTRMAARCIADEILKACGWPNDYKLPTTQPTQHNG